MVLYYAVSLINMVYVTVTGKVRLNKLPQGVKNFIDLTDLFDVKYS